MSAPEVVIEKAKDKRKPGRIHPKDIHGTAALQAVIAYCQSRLMSIETKKARDTNER